MEHQAPETHPEPEGNADSIAESAFTRIFMHIFVIAFLT